MEKGIPETGLQLQELPFGLLPILLALLDPPEPSTGQYSHIRGTATLQELVYFTAGWQGLDYVGEEVRVGEGWQNATVHRPPTADLSLDRPIFYAGTVERVDSSGKITDVVLSFAGMQLDPTIAVGGVEVIAGVPGAHLQRAIEMFDAIMHDPRYADAKIHVTGYSLGTNSAAWVLAHSIHVYGETITDQRVDFTSFAPARGHEQASAWYGLDSHEVFDGRWTNYQVVNDPNRVPAPVGVGMDFVGTEVILPAYNVPQGGDAGDAHLWNFIAIGLGLPDWVPEEEKQFIYEQAGFTSAVGYSEPGRAALTIEGDDAGTVLRGGEGNDRIGGGLGVDTIYGGAGVDTFVFNSILDASYTNGRVDLIADFQKGEKIDLSAIDAIASPNLWGENPDDAFTFIGHSGFTAPGQLRSLRGEGNINWVAGNTDADLEPEFIIAIDYSAAMQASYFIL